MITNELWTVVATTLYFSISFTYYFTEVLVLHWMTAWCCVENWYKYVWQRLLTWWLLAGWYSTCRECWYFLTKIPAVTNSLFSRYCTHGCRLYGRPTTSTCSYYSRSVVVALSHMNVLESGIIIITITHKYSWYFVVHVRCRQVVSKSSKQVSNKIQEIISTEPEITDVPNSYRHYPRSMNNGQLCSVQRLPYCCWQGTRWWRRWLELMVFSHGSSVYYYSYGHSMFQQPQMVGTVWSLLMPLLS